MPISLDEIDQFHRFATDRVGSGAVSSFEDLYLQWSALSDRSNVNEEIKCGLADVAEGRYAPATEVAERLGRDSGSLPNEVCRLRD